MTYTRTVFTCLTLFTLLFVLLFTLSPLTSSLAEQVETTGPSVPYIVEEACPFEGCQYGQWDVRSPAVLYHEPRQTSRPLLVIPAGETVQILTGEVHVLPGVARKVSDPLEPSFNANSASSPLPLKFDAQKDIVLLDYIGDGFSQVYHNDHYATVRIARNEDTCATQPDWNLCWVEVLQEPHSRFWVYAHVPSSAVRGWIWAEGRSMRPAKPQASVRPKLPSLADARR